MKPLGIGQDGDVWATKVAVMESMSNRPWKVTVAPGVVEGCRRVTLATVPEPVRTQRPMFLRRQNRAMASTMSFPPGTSRMYGLIAGSVSRVMTTGGLGLFLEPGGRPLGLLTTSMVAPSPGWLVSERDLLLGPWAVAAAAPLLLRLVSSSSEVWHSLEGVIWKGKGFPKG